MDTIFKTLEIKKISEDILLVILNRPEVRNAINIDMMHDLFNLWHLMYINLQGVRCIVLTGAGDKAFCAGADLKERKDMDIKIWREQHATLQKAILAMHDVPVPIIAAVNGAAYGGGLELTLACDFAYAAESAVFSQSEVKIGIMPGALGTQNLPRAVGLRRAKELAYTGDSFTAQQAYEWGLVNKVCADNQLLDTALLTAKKIADNAPLSIRQTKKAMAFSQFSDIKSGYAFEVEAYHHLLETEDRKEGITAFNEKRKPIFMGE